MNFINLLVSSFSTHGTKVINRFGQMQKNAVIRQQIMHERRELAEMADINLKDIGKGWVEARIEASRGYFDMPEHRLNDTSHAHHYRSGDHVRLEELRGPCTCSSLR